MFGQLLQALIQIKNATQRLLAALPARQKRMIFIGIPVFLLALTAGSRGIQILSYSPLFTQLTPQDAAAVVRELDAQHIPYELKEEGSVIEVPRKHLYRTRLELAGKGLPTGGSVGFEIFEKPPFGVSEFTQRINYLRALQGELTRTINSMGAVQSSRVHIALPARSSFFGADEKPSASVVMNLRNGHDLTPEQTQGIVRLVAASVPGLSPEKVAVVDASGGLLTVADAREQETETEHLHRLKVKTQKEIENRIQGMLEPVIGPGKAIARVSVDLNFQETEKTQEEFDPKSQVVRSQQQTMEGSGGQTSGVPGVQSNVPGGDARKAPEKAGEKITEKGREPGPVRSSQSVNYEIARTMSKTFEPKGQITRLSVAVMVDGKYEDNKYIARAPEEMEALKGIVMKAVGYDSERGDQVEVINVPIKFEAAPRAARVREAAAPAPWYLDPIWIGAGAGGFLLLVIVAFLLLRRKPAQATAPAVAEPGFVSPRREVAEVSGAVEKIVVAADPRREQIAQMAKDYRDEIAQILRVWLTESEGRRRPAEKPPIEVEGREEEERPA
jgi:flagellar M-ring protein FliF